MADFNVLSVTQLNRYIKSIITTDSKLSGIFIEGEISGFKNHIASGHLYFTLKDDASSIKVVMFKTNASKLKFVPQNGMSVIILGDISVYERDGQYQLYAFDIIPKGTGALYLAFEQLKEKLQKEGLFDVENKKALPLFPHKIGVVTSETGAALQDILNILSRRYPVAEVVLCPVLVQGESAPAQISMAIDTLNRKNTCDVIIVGRGGGSQEELWAFNTEPVAKAIYRSKIPVISAVGHETDTSISDFVADLRAPTPSAAAELVAPNLSDLSVILQNRFDKFSLILRKKLSDASVKLINLTSSGILSNPDNILGAKRDFLKDKAKRIISAENQILDSAKNKIYNWATILKNLDPLAIISRGYSIIKLNDKIISNVNELKKGDEVNIIFKDSSASATINKIEKGKCE